MSFVQAHEGESGIVYCASRRKVEELAETLKKEGVNALPYHAGLDKTVRDTNQDRFQQEDGVVMTAMSASPLTTGPTTNGPPSCGRSFGFNSAAMPRRSISCAK